MTLSLLMNPISSIIALVLAYYVDLLESEQ